HFAYQKQYSQKEEPLKALVIALDLSRGQFGLGQRSQPALIKNVHRARATQVQIKSFGGLGNVGEQLLVELRQDFVAPGILHKFRAAARIGDTELLAVGRADTDRENTQANLGRFFGGIDRFALLVFAIGKEHENFVVVALV